MTVVDIEVSDVERGHLDCLEYLTQRYKIYRLHSIGFPFLPHTVSLIEIH